jgi:branched-chain amino acid transport system ATP-binding protein
MTVLLEARDLYKSYGAHPVLRGVNLTVEEGETHAVIGPNGAGKTTFIRVLTGEAPATSGSVRFAGADVTRLPEFRRAALGMGRTFQVARIFPEMTARENVVAALEFGAQKPRRLALRPPLSARREAEILLEEAQLAPLGDNLAGALAHGDKKRLELTMALALRPRLLFLDEPTAGMAIADRRAATAMLARLVKERGLSLLLTEHDMELVFALSTRLTVLNYGEVLASGAPATVRDDPVVRKVYLGRAHVA